MNQNTKKKTRLNSYIKLAIHRAFIIIFGKKLKTNGHEKRAMQKKNVKNNIKAITEDEKYIDKKHLTRGNERFSELPKQSMLYGKKKRTNVSQENYIQKIILARVKINQ